MSKISIKLGDVCITNRETLTNKSEINFIDYLDTGSITRNKILGYKRFQKNDDSLPSRAKRVVKNNTIIYSTVRPEQEHFGMFEENPENIIVSTGFITLDVIDYRILPKYLYYALTQKRITNYLNVIAASNVTSYPSLNPSDVESLSFEFPNSIYTQQKIASVLSSLDSKIQLNNRINAELEAMAKTLYDYWFVQFDFPYSPTLEGCLQDGVVGKPYKSSGGTMVWNEELKRELPEGWEVGTLLDLGEIIGGSTPPREISEYFSDNGTAWITPKDLSLNTGNKFITKGELDVTELGIRAASLRVMPKGTILLSSRAPIGYLAIARESVTTNQGFKSFVVKQGFSVEYVYYTVKNLIPSIENMAVGSTFKEVSASTLKSISVCLPDKDIISKYTQKVEAIFKRQDNLEIENQKLSELRDWLLPMLMNGQVRVK